MLGASGGVVSGSGSVQTSAMGQATRRLHETAGLGQARLGVPLEPHIVLDKVPGSKKRIYRMAAALVNAIPGADNPRGFVGAAGVRAMTGYCGRCGRYALDDMCKPCTRLHEGAEETVRAILTNIDKDLDSFPDPASYELSTLLKHRISVFVNHVASNMDMLSSLDFARVLRDNANRHRDGDNPIVTEMLEAYAEHAEDEGRSHILRDAEEYRGSMKEYRSKAADIKKRAANVRIAKEISDKYRDGGSPVADGIIAKHLGDDTEADPGELEAEASSLEARAKGLEDKLNRLKKVMGGSPGQFHSATCHDCNATTWFLPSDQRIECIECGASRDNR